MVRAGHPNRIVADREAVEILFAFDVDRNIRIPCGVTDPSGDIGEFDLVAFERRRMVKRPPCRQRRLRVGDR
jgi:hypothetical protein